MVFENASVFHQTKAQPFPFGPFIINKNNQISICFSLYAPDATNVQLLLANANVLNTPIPMESKGSGWFQCETSQATVGSLYHFQIDNGLIVPDPASRFQPQGVSGPSQVIDNSRFDWLDNSWEGNAWEEAIIYELHIGTFSKEGTYTGAQKHLDELVALGITAVEILPLSEFAGARNWGYDGVYPYAPSHCYGSPDELKQFIQTAHQKGLMVFLDVVYNHFGPEGNYLSAYASNFFTDRHKSPWGAGINFDGPSSQPIRQFFIQNALYWIEEYHFDGLRLDAIHTIQDDSPIPMLKELAQRIHDGPNKNKPVHLILENEFNQASWLDGSTVNLQDSVQVACSSGYTAQWNDDIHHCLHVLATGQTDSYYIDYSNDAVKYLARALANGFAYQGEASLLRKGQHRGEKSDHLPSTAFIAFLQNHDQIGNHPFGYRASVLTPLKLLKANLTLMMLSPQIPMLFMGEEWLASQPFPFFCDFHDELGKLITEGRQQEFSHVPEFSDADKQKLIPDPNKEETFKSAILQWEDRQHSPHLDWLNYYRELIAVRKHEIIPLLKHGLAHAKPQILLIEDKALGLYWQWQDVETNSHELWLYANWRNTLIQVDFSSKAAHLIAESHIGSFNKLLTGELMPECVIWLKA